jgi:hypothetical protein
MSNGSPCISVCASMTNPWTTKCGYKSCKGCLECTGATEPYKAIVTCTASCPILTSSWSTKCGWGGCKECGECADVCPDICDTEPIFTCGWEICKKCEVCK